MPHSQPNYFYAFPTLFWVDKFNEIKISFVTCTIDLVGQSRLTTTLTISISVIRSAYTDPESQGIELNRIECDIE